MSNEKEYYLNIKGEKVVVSEEVYRAYVRPIRAEQRQKRREWRCRVQGEKGNLIRCQKDCSQCEYAKAGKNAMGNTLSLDAFKADGVEIVDQDFNLEETFIENEDRTSLQERLHKAIEKLTPRQQEIIRWIYFEGKTEREVAAFYGITQQAVHNALVKIIRRLKNLL